MPPTTSRRQPAPAAQPAGRSRNEAFENIFGRSAVPHHLAQNAAGGSAGPSHGPPPVPPGAGYGYRVPSGSGPPTGAYMNPAQPSLPPGQPSYPPGQGFNAPPPRTASYGYATGQPPHAPQQTQLQPRPSQVYRERPQFESSGGPSYLRPTPQPNAYADPSGPNRRTSMATSTHSSHSQSSYYTAQTSVEPPSPRSRGQQNGGGPQRLPPLDFSRPDPPRLSVDPNASAYGGYDSAGPSPASTVFPHRSDQVPARAGPSTSTTSLPDPRAYTSPMSTNAPAPYPRADMRSPESELESTERLMSPPPDYINAIGALSFDGNRSGPSEDVYGISEKAGPSSESLRGEFSRSDDHLARNFAQAPPNGRAPERSNMSASPAHRRMASDASATSSGAYTMTSNGRVAALPPIGQSPGSPFYDSPTTPTGSELDQARNDRRYSNRKSVDSIRSLPPPSSRELAKMTSSANASPINVRPPSFSGSTSSRPENMNDVRGGDVGRQNSRRLAVGQNPPSAYGLATPRSSLRSHTGSLHRSSSSVRAIALQALPPIYPALLSRVADAFKQLINLAELVKEGITYKEAFDGRSAVTIIADIIKTPDRNLALLLGRALDSQKFFHDVTYDHRLRDNPNEIYRFRERLAAPFMNEDAMNDSPKSDHTGLQQTQFPSRPGVSRYTSETGSIQTSESTRSFAPTPATSTTSLTYTSSSPQTLLKTMSENSVPQGLNTLADDSGEFDDSLPSGVFTLLTDCYSPTCSRDNLCYSINCPRRLEQMKRLNMKPQPGLTRKISDESLKDIKETGALWIHSVSKEILDSVDDTEKKRQEAINEVMYTERDFVRDLEFLKDSWAKPLRTQSDVIADPKRREDFVTQVFWNFQDILAVNHVLAERLTKRQKQQPVVQTIGDIFLERVPLFEPFVKYGSHQLFGKFEFEKEKGNNPAFQRFVDETERKPESRKLELNGYLTKPTTRLGRYPLLLEAVLKYTSDDNPDKKDLPEVIKTIKAFLAKVNVESGKSENIFELAQIEAQLVYRPSETIDLRLKDKNRELVHKGPLKRRGGNRDEIADLVGFLFDHAFLLVRPKLVNRGEQLRVYRRPIPLELMVVVTPDEHYNATKLSNSRSKLIARGGVGTISKTGSGSIVPPKPESKHGFSITIIHLGKKGYALQLWVDTYVGRKKWLEAMDKQQSSLRDRTCIFASETITDGVFGGLRKLNCATTYDAGNRMIYGTDEGVYFSNLRDEKHCHPMKVINLLEVTQVDVIEDFQLLIVLHERSVTTFPLDSLDPNDPNAALKRGKRIASHTSFFKSGVCLGKMLVAVVKSSSLSSTIKVLEPVDQSMRGKKPQTSFMKSLKGQNEALKLFKEFYIPTESSSVHFLKTKLCVGCTRGFEIVDLETLDMQGLLDPSDTSLDFVLKRDNVRPIAIYRVEEDFLLCYDEFAFYINKNGWRARPNWAIIWEGTPTAFALQYPYVIAFEPSFIEVHHVETAALVQIIPGNHLSCLFADTPPSRVNAPFAPQRRLMPQVNPFGNNSPSAFPSAHPQAPFPPQAAAGGFGRPPFPPGPAGQVRPSSMMPGQPGPPGAGRPFMPMPAQGGMPPPGGVPGYGVRPPAVMPKHLRDQIIFNSDDGHVQFLKLAPNPMPANGASPNGRSPAMMHRQRMSH